MVKLDVGMSLIRVHRLASSENSRDRDARGKCARKNRKDFHARDYNKSPNPVTVNSSHGVGENSALGDGREGDGWQTAGDTARPLGAWLGCTG